MHNAARYLTFLILSSSQIGEDVSATTTTKLDACGLKDFIVGFVFDTTSSMSGKFQGKLSSFLNKMVIYTLKTGLY